MKERRHSLQNYLEGTNMKFLDQLGDAVKDVKELAKSKASVVKDLTADAAQEVKVLAKEKAKDVKAKSADAAQEVKVDRKSVV